MVIYTCLLQSPYMDYNAIMYSYDNVQHVTIYLLKVHVGIVSCLNVLRLMLDGYLDYFIGE